MTAVLWDVRGARAHSKLLGRAVALALNVASGTGRSLYTLNGVVCPRHWRKTHVNLLKISSDDSPVMDSHCSRFLSSVATEVHFLLVGQQWKLQKAAHPIPWIIGSLYISCYQIFTVTSSI